MPRYRIEIYDHDGNIILKSETSCVTDIEIIVRVALYNSREKIILKLIRDKNDGD